MANYLVYWKTFWLDQDDGDDDYASYWYTDNKNFRDKLRKGDKFWIVIGGGNSASNEWRLLQKFVVSHVIPGTVQSKWGKYGIKGISNRNPSFVIERQPDFTAILWMLEFSTGKRIRTLGQKIGQSLQTHGHRTLTESDAVLLEKYAKCLSKSRS